ncbi:HPF/RaiA family ribosome-associated protein [Terriglobus roseus]|uniref:Putative sigma-54 modulation protein n=1 Tax=Terriglobus roseus TaxID=392734 RepID=A0A1H4JKD7_9BACT|nr:HPF/RaiA family ribosome-associated protein [Terriglobus roseus]SEB46326.1 putative sigma-54 modulation protein [Terriglobus roseus]
MDLEITGRGTQVTAKLRQQAEEGLARIEKVLGPKCVAKIVLSCEKNRCEVEVTVRNTIADFSSRTSAKEIEVALKDALDKVEQQAVKARKKVLTNSHHPEHTATGSIRLQTTDADEANTVKSKTDPESKRLSQSKTGVGKAIAAIDDGDFGDEQDIEAA